MLRKIIEKYKSVKNDYLNRTPKGKWLFVRNIGIFLLSVTGVAVLDPNFKIDWHSYTPAVSIVTIFTSFFYTLWYYLNTTTAINGFLIIPMFGILIPSMIAYFVVMNESKRNKFQSLLFFAGNKIYTNLHEDSNVNYIRVCNESAIKLFTSTLKTCSIVIASLIIYLGFPIYVLIVEQKIQLAIPVFFPFTDLETIHGLYINILHQAFLALTGITTNIGIEIMTCMLKNTVWAVMISICHSIDEISESVQHPESHSGGQFDYQFRNMMIQVQDLNGFILGLSDIYYWKFFLQPFLLTFSVALAGLFYLISDWVSGLGAALLCYIQLYILCDIGNEVDSANKLLVLKLHDMPWYLMSRQNQLCYAHILNRLQNGAILKMGPFAELNFESFSDMTNKIFSTFMMLNKLIK